MKETLATIHPNLVPEWHPTKNGKLLPTTVPANSHRKVWWLGKCGHEWTAAVSTRIAKDSGCAVCSGKQVLQGFNDFATTHPDLASQWHPTKNESLSPVDITVKSTKTIWWKAECSHEWNSKASPRAAGDGCPYCSGKTLLPGFNDLATLFPVIAAEWNTARNTSFPSDIKSNSVSKAWWKCEFNHEWEARVSSRTEGSGCPYCSGRNSIPGKTDVATLHPELIKEWHPDNKTSLSEYRPGSQEKGQWLCSQGHVWTAPIRNRVNGSGCIICAKKQILAGHNDVETLAPHIAKLWNHEKNPLKPSEMFPGSEKVVHLVCELGHEWETKLSLTRDVARLCPVCAGRKALPGFNDLATTHPEIASEWHPTKNTIASKEVTAGMDKKIWWLGKCGHEWESTICSRSGHQKQGCPVCASKVVLAGFNDLSSSNPIVASEWHPTKNGTLFPTMVSRAANRRVWWICASGHEWEAKVGDRTVKSSGCPSCSNSISKDEQAIADFLTDNGFVVEQSNRKILNGLELDIYVPSHNIAIEYNGIYWHTESRGKDKGYHKKKWLIAKNSGIQLIQIWEDEWKNNPEQIKSMLLHKLGAGVSEKVYARKTTVVQLSTTEAHDFFEAHHVQGYASASYYYGLTNDNGIKSVLALKKEPNNVLNIIRYATSANVVGGFTKLLKHAEKIHQPEEFITFSDNCVSDGGLYANNGFAADREIEPDYRYVVGLERRHKFGYRIKRFKNDPNLLWQPGMTEKQLADLNGLDRIWDAGKTKWIKKIQK